MSDNVSDVAHRFSLGWLDVPGIHVNLYEQWNGNLFRMGNGILLEWEIKLSVLITVSV